MPMIIFGGISDTLTAPSPIRKNGNKQCRYCIHHVLQSTNMVSLIVGQVS